MSIPLYFCQFFDKTGWREEGTPPRCPDKLRARMNPRARRPLREDEMISEDEICKRMNLLMAKIVHDHDQDGGVEGPVPTFNAIFRLDGIIGKWINEIATGPNVTSYREGAETMFAMSRLYLELYDRLDEPDKKFLEDTREWKTVFHFFEPEKSETVTED